MILKFRPSSKPSKSDSIARIATSNWPLEMDVCMDTYPERIIQSESSTALPVGAADFRQWWDWRSDCTGRRRLIPTRRRGRNLIPTTDSGVERWQERSSCWRWLGGCSVIPATTLSTSYATVRAVRPWRLIVFRSYAVFRPCTHSKDHRDWVPSHLKRFRTDLDPPKRTSFPPPFVPATR